MAEENRQTSSHVGVRIGKFVMVCVCVCVCVSLESTEVQRKIC